ncbi:hypothetical protein ACTXT7_005650 [Hymenolepis weldensis]
MFDPVRWRNFDFIPARQSNKPYPWECISYPLFSMYQAPLKEAGVGTFKNLSLVLTSTKLVDALAFFENETVSVLPVVDSFSNRRLLDIFAKFDVIVSNASLLFVTSISIAFAQAQSFYYDFEGLVFDTSVSLNVLQISLIARYTH